MTIHQIYIPYWLIIFLLGVLLLVFFWKQLVYRYKKFREYNELNTFLTYSTAFLVTAVVFLNLIMCLMLKKASFLDSFFLSIKAAFDVLSGDSEEFRSLGTSSTLFHYSTVLLSIITPIATAGTIIQFVLRHRPRLMLFGKEFFIFSVLNQHSVALAKSLMKEHRHNSRCVFLRTSIDRADADAVSELRGMKYFLFNGTEADLLKQRRRLGKKELRFFFVSDRTEENFASAEAFMDAVKRYALFQKQEKRSFNNELFQQELYLLAETESAPLLIDNLRKKMFVSGERHPVFQNTELRLLDRYRSIVYGLLSRAPIHSNISPNEEAVVMILGMGHIGTEFLRAASSFSVCPDKKCRFILCDININQKNSLLQKKYPEFMCSVKNELLDFNVETDAFYSRLDNYSQCNPITYIVVSLGDDERNIHAAMALMRYYRRKIWKRENCKVPVICVNLEDTLKSTYFETLLENEQDFQFVVFGSDEETFSEKNLLPRNVWKAARVIHSNLSPVRSEEWTEYERRSSIACVCHAGCYLLSAGMDYAQYVNQNREKLIRTEHERWMQYVRSEGIQKASLDEVGVYFPKLQRHVDIVGQLSPCLVDASELDELHRKLIEMTQNPKLPSFRERDTFVIEHAQEIQKIINTGEISEKLKKKG